MSSTAFHPKCQCRLLHTWHLRHPLSPSSAVHCRPSRHAALVARSRLALSRALLSTTTVKARSSRLACSSSSKTSSLAWLTHRLVPCSLPPQSRRVLRAWLAPRLPQHQGLLMPATLLEDPTPQQQCTAVFLKNRLFSDLEG